MDTHHSPLTAYHFAVGVSWPADKSSPIHLSERAALVQLVYVTLHAARFAREKLLDCLCEFGASEPMGRTGWRGHQTARHLVLALRAALEHRDAARDAIFDCLVVAALEMQHGQVLDRSPMPPVELVAVADVQCGRYRCARAPRQYQHGVMRKRAAEPQEKLQI